jgi:hypothetical protein
MRFYGRYGADQGLFSAFDYSDEILPLRLAQRDGFRKRLNPSCGLSSIPDPGNRLKCKD